MAQAFFIGSRNAPQREAQNRPEPADREQRLERSRQVAERLKRREQGRRSDYSRWAYGARPAVLLAVLAVLVAVAYAVQAVTI